MPELPEVETVRRILAADIVGLPVGAVTVGHPRMLRRQPRGTEFAARLVNRHITSIDRHGKFLLSRLEDESTWVMHLGMSGHLELADPLDSVEPHTHVQVLVGGREVRLIDPRTFGFTAVVTSTELEEGFRSRLGRDALLDLPEPSVLESWLRGRKAPVKSLLLDQRLIAGLGNIYTDEILFRSGIVGLRAGGSLTSAEIRNLHDNVGPVLNEAIADGGTTLGDLAYLLPDGRATDHSVRLAVYGRTGAPCRVCGSTILRATVAGRGTSWCPTCQR